MDLFKGRRQWKDSFRPGPDGNRRGLNLSYAAFAGFLLFLLCFIVLIVLYLDIRHKGEAHSRLEKENALLREKVDYYSAAIDSIYQKLDSLNLLNHNSNNNESLYPYSPVANEALIENAFIYDTYLDARVNRAEQQIQSISLILNPDTGSETASESSFAGLAGGPSIFPTFGKITDGWGVRMHPVHRRLFFHRGIDIANKTGTPIYATADGEVVLTGYDREYGKIIKLKHDNNYETRYGHLLTFRVAIGDQVRKGQIIALMGSTGMSTGPHLHYEVLVNGVKVNPSRYLNRAEDPVYYVRK